VFLKKARDIVLHINSLIAVNEGLAQDRRKKSPSRFAYKLYQDVITRWDWKFKLVEIVVKPEEPIKDILHRKSRSRTSVKNPMPLAENYLSDDNFDGLHNILHIW